MIAVVLEQRKTLHVKDLTVGEYWAKLTELSENVVEIITFSKDCTEFLFFG